MEAWLLYAGIALCLFSLWAIARRDLVRWRGSSETVVAEVAGHRSVREDNGISYAAIWQFTAEGAVHDVQDEVLHPAPRHPLGTKATLVYPRGRPDLAHVPRPLMWSAVYVLLIGLTLILVARLFDWLPSGDGDIVG